MRNLTDKEKRNLKLAGAVVFGGLLVYAGFKYGEDITMKKIVHQDPEKIREYEEMITGAARESLFEKAKIAVAQEVRKQEYQKARAQLVNEAYDRIEDAAREKLYRKARNDLVEEIRVEERIKAREDIRKEFESMAELVANFTSKQSEHASSPNNNTIIIGKDD